MIRKVLVARPLNITLPLPRVRRPPRHAVRCRQKGQVARPHNHLGGAHAFIVSGELQVRDTVLNAGDNVYEPPGLIHDATWPKQDWQVSSERSRKPAVRSGSIVQPVPGTCETRSPHIGWALEEMWIAISLRMRCD
jgi:hypothetical protein